ncbi:hypothetical protein L1987_45454 [Smallanthus sonchifolius]|uniref:Uncharacterized protein n=1 Tax=Smallanthus sonchifolius TaxID=185202 RepID=A0ACB9FXZ6_9ASTR|nr:hypothetical protein L1987_45454 [Smallanthus sonchifolius]
MNVHSVVIVPPLSSQKDLVIYGFLLFSLFTIATIDWHGRRGPPPLPVMPLRAGHLVVRIPLRSPINQFSMLYKEDEVSGDSCQKPQIAYSFCSWKSRYEPAEYHCKWTFKWVFGIQEPASVAFTALNMSMHFHGWLSFFILLHYSAIVQRGEQDENVKKEFFAKFVIYQMISGYIVLLAVVSIRLARFCNVISLNRSFLGTPTKEDWPDVTTRLKVWGKNIPYENVRTPSNANT